MKVDLQRAQMTQRAEKIWPPPVPFKRVTRDRKKKDDDDEDKEKLRSFEIAFDPTDEDSDTYMRKVRVFEEGSPEEWVLHQMEVEDLFTTAGYVESEKKLAVWRALFDGKAKDYFRHYLNTRTVENNARDAADRLNGNDLLRQVLNDVARKIFGNEWKIAARTQKTYMRNNLHIEDRNPEVFFDRLKEMNRYLPYFPYRDDQNPPDTLPEDEIMDILDRAKKIDWHVTMLSQGRRPESFDNAEGLVEYLKQLYAADKLAKAIKGGPTRSKDSKRPSDSSDKNGRPRKRQRGGNNKSDRTKACVHCGKWHPSPDHECWHKDGNKKDSPSRDEKKSENNKWKRQYKQFANYMETQEKKKEKAQKKNKKKEAADSDDDTTCSEFDNNMARLRGEVDDLSINSVSEENMCYAFAPREPPTKKTKTSHYSPEVVVEIEDRKGKIVPIRALLDTGTTATILLRNFVRKGRAKGYAGKPTKWNTMGGNFVTKRKALVDFRLPEFDPKKKVTYIVHVDERTDAKTSQFDMIIGMDLLTELGIDIKTSTKEVIWEHHTIDLKRKGLLNNEKILNTIYEQATVPSTLKEAENRQARILDADYSKINIEEHVKTLPHLSTVEQEKLIMLLARHPKMFQGGLGTLNIKPIHLELKEDAQPYHARPFQIPQSLLKTTRKEVDRLTDIRVLIKSKDSEWAAPTFVIPKKTGDVRLITDFRKLNLCIKRKPFPLPKISDILQRMTGFTYATAIDLSMGYYHIPLDAASQKLCGMVLPWGKYQYARLPMGVSNSPDIFQEIMTDLVGDLDYTTAYMDDILVTTNGDFDDHLAKLEEVLQRLERAGFRANVKKCFFGEGQLEYLGYWLTRDGIQPQPKKVEAIQRLKPPKNKKELRHFLGMVNYYRDMWKRRSHMLAPLSGLVSKTAKWIWGETQQKAFDEIKRAISKDTLLAFPDFNEEFHIYTDASDYQLGAVIMQKNKPLAFYSRKLNKAQRRYTTGEQELLSIVETLKEFKNILLGQKLTVHTDHKNILYGNLSNDRITRWRLLLEEYGPTFLHVKGEDNVVADALSRLDATFPSEPEEEDAHHIAYCMSHLYRDETHKLPTGKNKFEMANHYGATPEEIDEEQFPMRPALVYEEQQTDKIIRRLVKEKDPNLSKKNIEDKDLICYKGRIMVPSSLKERIMDWYHQFLAHPGMTRMTATIKQHYYWHRMDNDIQHYVKTCKTCQLTKKGKNKYGHLPPKQAEPEIPWNRVNVDLMGPFTVNTPKGKKKLLTLTMIDPATGWFEIKDVPIDSSAAVSAAFDDVWLCRYPRPQYIGFDNGKEYKKVFKEMVRNYGMTGKPSTTYNPQSNGIIERVHQTLQNSMRALEIGEQELEEHDPWSKILSAISYATRSTYHTGYSATPGQLVYGRDMVLPIKFEADWNKIQLDRQAKINANNARENRNRIPHEYKAGDKVLLTKTGILPKMEAPRTGPHTINKVYPNGTVELQRGTISERVNIRRLLPFFEDS